MSPRDTRYLGSRYLGSRLRDWMLPAIAEMVVELGLVTVLLGVLLDPRPEMTPAWQIAGWVVVVAVAVHAVLQPFVAYHDWQTFRALLEPPAEAPDAP